MLLWHIYLVILLLAGCQNTGGTRPVYGFDTRDEVVNGGPLLCRAASATAAVFNQDVFEQPIVDRQWRYRQRQDLISRGWCSSERFADQNALAYCTAFLIAQDIVVTAGHCVNAHQDSEGDGLDCKETLFVFDYRMGIDGLSPAFFSDASVYKCQTVLAGTTSAIGADWRVVKLDRSTNREPLSLYRGQPLATGTELIIIGHPLGLPMKFATGQVRNISPALSNSVFIADIDAFHSNSGSPVLQQLADQLEVVGLLTGGHLDSEYTSSNPECKTTVVCEESDQCSGELITTSEPLLRWSDNAINERTAQGTSAAHCFWCDHPLRSRHWQCPPRGREFE